MTRDITSIIAPYAGSLMILSAGMLALMAAFGRNIGLDRSERRVCGCLVLAASAAAVTWLLP